MYFFPTFFLYFWYMYFFFLVFVTTFVVFCFYSFRRCFVAMCVLCHFITTGFVFVDFVTTGFQYVNDSIYKTFSIKQKHQFKFGSSMLYN